MGGHDNRIVVTPLGCTAEQTAAAVTSIVRAYPGIVVECLDNTVRLTSQDYCTSEMTAIWWAAVANLAASKRASDGRRQIMNYLLA